MSEELKQEQNDGVALLSQEEEPQGEQPVEELEAQQPQESVHDRNYRKLREEKERLQKERDEMLKWMQQVTTTQKQPQQPEAPRPQYNPDDLVEWKVVDQEMNRLRSEFNQYKQQSHEQMVETQLRARYNDFDSVVSKENIELLRERFPEVANTISSSSDLYNKAASAYTLIKQFGIHREADYAPQRERAQVNVAKPKPAALVSPSIGSQALGAAAANDRKLTPDLQKRLREEMLANSKKGYFS